MTAIETLADTYRRQVKHTAPGAAVRTAAKRTFRAAGTVTAPLRPGPDVIVIGAKRGGSTSLHRYLLDHPSVLPTFPRAEHVKGTYWFTDHQDRSEAWYRSHFPTVITRAAVRRRTGAAVALESTPYYLYHPLAPARARAAVPDAHVVVALRNPVERAWSHWKERRANDDEPLSFPEALAAEPSRTRGETARLLADPQAVSAPHRHHSYLDQGRYAEPLRRWFAAYGRDRVHVIVCDDLFAEPAKVVGELYRALGLPHHDLRDTRVHNEAAEAPMDADTRAWLDRQYRDEIVELEELLGRSLPW
jgi:hypothetical protein